MRLVLVSNSGRRHCLQTIPLTRTVDVDRRGHRFERAPQLRHVDLDNLLRRRWFVSIHALVEDVRAKPRAWTPHKDRKEPAPLRSEVLGFTPRLIPQYALRLVVDDVGDRDCARHGLSPSSCVTCRNSTTRRSPLSITLKTSILRALHNPIIFI
jgi:hypothetical protein